MNHIDTLYWKLKQNGYAPRRTIILPINSKVTVNRGDIRVSAEDMYPDGKLCVTVVRPGIEPAFSGPLTAEEAFALFTKKLEER